MAFEKTNYGGFLFDRDSNVVININDADLRKYRNQVAQAKHTMEVEKKYEDLRAELDAIKMVIAELRG